MKSISLFLFHLLRVFCDYQFILVCSKSSFFWGLNCDEKLAKEVSFDDIQKPKLEYRSKLIDCTDLTIIIRPSSETIFTSKLQKALRNVLDFVIENATDSIHAYVKHNKGILIGFNEWLSVERSSKFQLVLDQFNLDFYLNKAHKINKCDSESVEKRIQGGRFLNFCANTSFGLVNKFPKDKICPYIFIKGCH
jgi:hypothetical protein